MGKAFICAVDDECGTNYSSRLGDNEGENKNKKCLYVGKGVLSKLVVFGNKLFANIAEDQLRLRKTLLQLSLSWVRFQALEAHGETETFSFYSIIS